MTARCQPLACSVIVRHPRRSRRGWAVFATLARVDFIYRAEERSRVAISRGPWRMPLFERLDRMRWQGSVG